MSDGTEQIVPPLPDGARHVGWLYAGPMPFRSEDMLDVELANGLLVTAGWYIDIDESQGREYEDGRGKYSVRVCRGMETIDFIEVQDVSNAAEAVESLARKWNA